MREITGIPEFNKNKEVRPCVQGGRFLRQEFRGTAEGQPPFEGIGVIAYTRA